MCGPHGLKFLQPVELQLPHCASVNPESWSFALKSSDSPSGKSYLPVSDKSFPPVYNCISSVMVGMLASSRVKPKTIKLIFAAFSLSMQHLRVRAKTGWLNQDNVSEWNNMTTHRLLLV